MTGNDRRHVGDLEQVLVGEDTKHTTHLVISHGLLLKKKRLVPVEWIDEVEEDEVRLAVGSRLIGTLPEYQE
ncbi:MAG: hypothetical protein AB1640_16940 [bacterium]